MQNSPQIVYCDDHYLLWRKPHGLASSWGQEECFLDTIQQSDDEMWKVQQRIFWRKEEYGLLNRLDALTAWLLYLARSVEAKKQYHALQQSWKIQKIYYAQVYGWPQGVFGWITTPIFHHAQISDRMTSDPTKWRSPQQASTYREVIEYWEKSRLRVVITKGVRHQIRVHLASIWCPIVWDELYMASWLRKRYALDIVGDRIELVSAGVEFQWWVVTDEF